MSIAMISLALIAQDATEWIRRLGDADPKARDAAVLRLKAIGDDAMPALREALESGDPEVAMRARMLVEYLDRTRRARKIAAAGKPLSLSIEEPRPLRDVLEAIGGHFGVAVEVSEALAERTWSGRFESLKLLQALDRIAADANSPYVILPGLIRLAEGRAAARPADYPGSFRVAVQSVQLNVTEEFTRRHASLTIALQAVHQSGLAEISGRAIDVTFVEFDTGETVEIKPNEKGERPTYDTRDPLTYGLSLAPPPADARAIRRLRGSLTVRAPSELETWALPSLEEGARAERPRATATLLGVDRGTYDDVPYVTLYLRLGGKSVTEADTAGVVRLLDEAGTEAPSARSWPARMSWSAYHQTVEVEARFVLPKGSTFVPATAALTVPTGYETIELPFEIRDVPIR